MIATASKTMASFEHTDPPFTANAPPLSATEPALPFVGAARWRLPSGSRQDDPPHTARERRLFILGGGKSAIRRGDMRRATEDLDVAIKCRRPQRHVRWSGRMDRVSGDDLMLAFLNRHELAECRRLRDLALPNRFRVAQRCSAPSRARACHRRAAARAIAQARA